MLCNLSPLLVTVVTPFKKKKVENLSPEKVAESKSSTVGNC